EGVSVYLSELLSPIRLPKCFGGRHYEWREELGKKYIFVPKRDSAFMTTETLEPMTSRQMELKGFFCVEYRGLWLFADRSKGGPFLSYAFLSPDKTRIYYLESYVFAPGEDKVEMLRQLEAVLRTFRYTTLPQQATRWNRQKYLNCRKENVGML
ncbi:MAG: DUF4837 family protein, partial [Chloroflexia bacterium]|nr:DUF4837 family protein [Chloroflexia bacterium]